ncbi:hypothetical protein HK101_007074 [Irineochytrium annulatum]|nr:hypothetical protein HK101_007074 [Irineochytrium annulatum]
MPRLPPELWAVILSLACDSFANLHLQRSINQSVSDYTRDLPAYKLARKLAQLRSTPSSSPDLFRPSSSRLDLLRLFRDSGSQHPDGFVDLVRLAIKDGTLRYEDDESPNTLYRFRIWFHGQQYKPLFDLLKASGFKKPFWQLESCEYDVNYSTLGNKMEDAFRHTYQYVMDEYNRVNVGWARVIWRLCERADDEDAYFNMFHDFNGRLVIEGYSHKLSNSTMMKARVEASRTCEICGRGGKRRYRVTTDADNGCCVQCDYCFSGEYDEEPEWDDVDSDCWGWEVNSEGFYVDEDGAITTDC